MPLKADAVQSCDGLLHLLRGVIDRKFDLFELYVIRNPLRVPDDIVIEEVSKSTSIVPASSGYLFMALCAHRVAHLGATPQQPAASASTAVTDDDMHKVNERISAAHTALSVARRRRRTLLMIKRMYAEKLPRCIELVSQIESAIHAFEEHSGT